MVRGQDPRDRRARGAGLGHARRGRPARPAAPRRRRRPLPRRGDRRGRRRAAGRDGPRLAGWAEHEAADGAATLGVLQEFVANRGDGWKHVLSALRGRLGAGPARSGPDPLVEEMRRLGTITGGLHAALASDAADPDFAPEPITRDDVARWAADIRRDVEAGDGWGLAGGGARPGRPDRARGARPPR